MKERDPAAFRDLQYRFSCTLTRHDGGLFSLCCSLSDYPPCLRYVVRFDGSLYEWTVISSAPVPLYRMMVLTGYLDEEDQYAPCMNSATG